MRFRLIPSILALAITSQVQAESFDYVIVGGGTAGLAIANRLSASGAYSVAVIEAGGFYEDEFPNAEIPSMVYMGIGTHPSITSPIDWNFVTEPQEGANGRALHYARGKCMGGSSARNYMFYHRGTTGSYQMWADEVGDQSYAFDQFEPFFRRSIHWTAPEVDAYDTNVTIRYEPSTYIPTGGPLKVSNPAFTQPIFSWFSKVLHELGVPLATDFSGGVLDGYKYLESTIDPRTRLRSDSATSYYAESADRPNLRVFTHSLAEKIVLDKTNTASGVIVNGSIIEAKKEVILSAGAFQSPQLLMLSGVGAQKELEEHGIKCLVDLPGVGKNMQDHVMYGPTVEVNLPTAMSNEVMQEALAGWQKDHSGRFSSPGAEAAGFGKMNATAMSTLTEETQKILQNDFPTDWPDLEYLPLPIFTGNWSGDTAPDTSRNYASWVMIPLKPLSRGTISLKSSNPNDAPIIAPNWLSHTADQETAIAAFRIARQIIASDAMAPILADPQKLESSPGFSVSTDEEVLTYIRDTICTVWHPSGTCKMGRPEDEMAVLDSRCRVRGVSKLRVVDASSFPFLPPGHPQSTVYALAEKIAQDILDDKREPLHDEL